MYEGAERGGEGPTAESAAQSDPAAGTFRDSAGEERSRITRSETTSKIAFARNDSGKATKKFEPAEIEIGKNAAARAQAGACEFEPVRGQIGPTAVRFSGSAHWGVGFIVL